MKKKVIIVTDGDMIAQEAVEEAARNIKGRCISLSGGNPTVLTGSMAIKLINKSESDPVVIMVDDRGDSGVGSGEKVMDEIINSEEVELMGIVAVASNTVNGKGIMVDCSIDKDGNVVNKSVDKYGNMQKSRVLKGDTVNILSNENVPYIIGIGDPGKMDGKDTAEFGAPIITAAMKKIIENFNMRDS